MTIVIFIIIIAVLIFVHELGHFSLAKLFHIRVDEFAIGFPPKLASIKKGETVYALNLLPFGGYVKIFGEDPTEEGVTESKNSFIGKRSSIQAAVMLGGIAFNIIFAWLLLS